METAQRPNSKYAPSAAPSAKSPQPVGGLRRWLPSGPVNACPTLRGLEACADGTATEQPARTCTTKQTHTVKGIALTAAALFASTNPNQQQKTADVQPVNQNRPPLGLMSARRQHGRSACRLRLRHAFHVGRPCRKQSHSISTAPSLLEVLLLQGVYRIRSSGLDAVEVLQRPLHRGKGT